MRANPSQTYTLAQITLLIMAPIVVRALFELCLVLLLIYLVVLGWNLLKYVADDWEGGLLEKSLNCAGNLRVKGLYASASLVKELQSLLIAYREPHELLLIILDNFQ